MKRFFSCPRCGRRYWGGAYDCKNVACRLSLIQGRKTWGMMIRLGQYDVEIFDEEDRTVIHSQTLIGSNYWIDVPKALSPKINLEELDKYLVLQ